MYTVSILSQSTRQWRSIQVPSLSQAVQLTLGLSTEYFIDDDSTGEQTRKFSYGMSDCWRCALTGRIVPVHVDAMTLTKRYAHALRALVQQWKRKHFDPVTCFRMSDSQLLFWHEHLAYSL